MPDETLEQIEERKAAEMADRIARGLSTGLKPVMEEIAANARVENRQAQPPPTSAVIADVPEEEILEAITAGDSKKAAMLRRQQRMYDRQQTEREMGTLRQNGTAAFASIARNSLTSDPVYKKFSKEVDKIIDDFVAQNPNAVLTREHCEYARDLVAGRHLADFTNETREETLRKAREPEEALIPNGGTRGAADHAEKEPERLSDVLVGDWKREFRSKASEVGGRSEEEELRKMGYQGGFKEFLGVRRNMEEVEDSTNGHFGLDKDWVWTDKNKGEGHWQ
jgi:hypothetical protein